MTLTIIILLCLTRGAYCLFCYNGTFSSKCFSRDPLVLRGLNAPERSVMARLRCSATVRCSVGVIDSTVALLCFNCSATHRDWSSTCPGAFAISKYPTFNDSRIFLVNCTSDDAMCFVRSWSSRSRFAWIVQRGCYQSPKDDPIPSTLQTPTRAMACRRDRLADAEYQVCLCKADWCNHSSHSIESSRLVLLPGLSIIKVFLNLFFLY
ncbi:uncharacterized protein LOC128676296 [Plodia interpunctella]|uniref:uncharacterized protein LOC128676296 n=1 Tax=Plodia interpunctella TaxID=58824 RepID=UPI00236828A5|nr:uncharacterized protein LOC128676296 isoform X1 [Plodia interpunctella]